MKSICLNNERYLSRKWKVFVQIMIIICLYSATSLIVTSTPCRLIYVAPTISKIYLYLCIDHSMYLSIFCAVFVQWVWLWQVATCPLIVPPPLQSFLSLTAWTEKEMTAFKAAHSFQIRSCNRYIAKLYCS